ADVLSFFALPALADVELDALAVLERLVALSLDLRVVDEDVFALVTGDEAVTLLGVEELHGACSHSSSFSFFPLYRALLSRGASRSRPPLPCRTCVRAPLALTFRTVAWAPAHRAPERGTQNRQN